MDGGTRISEHAATVRGGRWSVVVGENTPEENGIAAVCKGEVS